MLYRQSAEVEDVARALCAQHRGPLTVTAPVRARACGIEGQRFDYRDRRDLFLPLLGIYQLSNAAAALDAVDALVRERDYRISEDAVRQGLAAVRWNARLEILSRKPLVLLDGAHNPNGVGQLAASLQALFPGKKLTLVMGVMADKDYPTMLAQMVPCAARLITATPDYYRALPSDRLAQTARQVLTVPVTDGGALEHALALALRERGEDEAVCVFGTLYQAGAVRRFFGRE